MLAQLCAQLLRRIFSAGQGKYFFVTGNCRYQVLCASVHADDFGVIPGQLQLRGKIHQAADATVADTFTIRQLTADGFGEAEKAYIAGNQHRQHILFRLCLRCYFSNSRSFNCIIYSFAAVCKSSQHAFVANQDIT